MNLLVDAEGNAAEVERVVTLFEALPVDAQDAQLIRGDHHLADIHARNAFYVTK